MWRIPMMRLCFRFGSRLECAYPLYSAFRFYSAHPPVAGRKEDFNGCDRQACVGSTAGEIPLGTVRPTLCSRYESRRQSRRGRPEYGFCEADAATGTCASENENNILPLDKRQIRKVLVTGPLADEDNFMTSRYGPNGLETVTVLAGLRNYLKGIAEVDYAKGCDIVDAGWPATEILPAPMSEQEKQGIAEAVAKAGESDVIIAVLGEDEYRTGESRSRTSLDLPGRQQQLLEALHATGKPVILVLINGQPLTVNWANAYIPAILESWFPGCQGER